MWLWRRRPASNCAPHDEFRIFCNSTPIDVAQPCSVIRTVHIRGNGFLYFFSALMKTRILLLDAIRLCRAVWRNHPLKACLLILYRMHCAFTYSATSLPPHTPHTPLTHINSSCLLSSVRKVRCGGSWAGCVQNPISHSH